jgi:undecaprenyl-diphosphatase
VGSLGNSGAVRMAERSVLDWLKQAVGDADIYLFMAVNSLVGRSAAFDYCVQILDVWHLLLYGWMPIYLWMLWFDPQVEGSRIKIVSGLIGVGVATSLSVVLQRIFTIHPRPFVDSYELSVTLIEPPRLAEWYFQNSFPSDTATMCFAVATTIYMVSRKVGIFAFIWTATAVAFPRIYLAYHWPLDIVGAALLGPATVLLISGLPIVRFCSLFLVYFEKFGPQYFYPIAFIYTQQIVELFQGFQLGLRVSGKIMLAVLRM